MSMLTASPDARVEETYDAAAGYFDDDPLSFRARFGERTVARLALSPGAVVLDVGCGTGASAIPAARRVGRNGYVIGIDLSGLMVKRARAKARARGVANLDFRVGDMGELPFADGSFDAVISAFSIFFAPDMVAQVRALWRLVRPGGKVAITTWGPNAFEPALSAWWRAVEQYCPGIDRVPLPRDRLAEIAALRTLLSDAGISEAEVAAEEGRQALRTAEDWWTIVLGTGARGVIDRLPSEQVARVRAANLAWLDEDGVDSVETNVHYAVATKGWR
jgi:ubiquinone/menaquinone biosynthesis C-methylase UbiE